MLPMLSSHKNRSSLAASLTKLNNRSKVQLIKPVSQSQRLSMDLKKQLVDDNLKMMSRIVNAPPGVVPFDKLKDQYR